VIIESVPTNIPLARTFGYEGNTGALVTTVAPGTPAEGKLLSGDIVTAIDGKSLNDADELHNTVAETAPGTVVHLTVFRDGRQITVALTIGTQPENMEAMLPGRGGEGPNAGGDQPEDAQATALGLRLGSLTPELAQQLNLDPQTVGAVITDVKPGSVASRAGLVPNNVITHVGRRSVGDAHEAYAALSRGDLKRGIRLTVLTADGSNFVVLQEDNSDSNN